MKIIEQYKHYLLKAQEKDISEYSLKTFFCYVYNFDSFTTLVLNYNEEAKTFSKKEIKKMDKLLSGFPVQYLFKKADFYNLSLYVNKNVLIPRSETEELIENIIKVSQMTLKKINNINMLDLCCGSGNICFALERSLNKRFDQIIAVDNSFKALKVAKKNKKQLGSAVKLTRKDYKKFIEKNELKFNIVTCNPPYISKINEIDKSVIDNEPKKALITYPSYSFYEYIFINLFKIVASTFVFAFEIGYDQKEILEAILKKQSYINEIEYQFIKDIYGKDRILIISSK